MSCATPFVFALAADLSNPQASPMKHLIESVAALIAVTTWIAGLVLAKGFWSTFFGVFLPPWAWYLVVERCMQHLGWI